MLTWTVDRVPTYAVCTLHSQRTGDMPGTGRLDGAGDHRGNVVIGYFVHEADCCTPSGPNGRLVTVDEVVDAVWLCVTNPALNGQGITIDGGRVQP